MSSSDLEVILHSLPFLWQGLKLTLLLTVIAGVAGLVCGIGLALLRLSRFRGLAWIAFGYVSLLRSIPLLLVLLWFYLLVPMITSYSFGAFESALIGLTMFEAAYYCEIVRAGILAVPALQKQAALASGLSRGQVTRFIVLPQALRKMTPVLLTQSILLFMDTSVVFILGLRDFMGVTNLIATREARVIPMFLFAACVYFAISLTASRLVGTLQRRLAPV